MVSISLNLETTIKLGIWKEAMDTHRENLSRLPLSTDLSRGGKHTDTIPKDKRSPSTSKRTIVKGEFTVPITRYIPEVMR